MIFDTDVLIWYQKRSLRAVHFIDSVDADHRFISVQTYMEFLQGSRSKSEVALMRDFLNKLSFRILPLTENIGHRASMWIEDYSGSTGLRSGDAIIAATAMENNLPLVSANFKHFKRIHNLKLVKFKP